MSGSQFNIALIGLGVMGQRMLANMTTHGGYDLVAAWDPNLSACEQTHASYPSLRIAADADDAITDPRAEVVYIASPPAVHKQYAMSAIEHGKIVFCEKPLGVDVEQSRQLVAYAESSGVINAVNFSFAAKAASERIKDALDEGAVGRVVGVDVRLHFCRWPRDWQAGATWLAKRDQGGFVREVLSHYVYLTQRLFGRSTLGNAVVRYPDDGESAETHVLANLDCGRIPVSVAGGTGGVGPDRVEYTIWGTELSYRLYDWNRLKSSSGGDWVDELTQLDNPRQEGYMRMLDNLHALLRGEPHTMPSFRDALSVQEIIEGILTPGGKRVSPDRRMY
ncbi:MAG: Gfo/Idh/MocA family protein [Acidiferrobacterales bacterium]